MLDRKRIFAHIPKISIESGLPDSFLGKMCCDTTYYYIGFSPHFLQQQKKHNFIKYSMPADAYIADVCIDCHNKHKIKLSLQ
jgi:hypothetical protein